MIKRRTAIIVAIIIILGLFLPSSFTSAGTILSSYKFAWSNNAGYINFENVVVDDSALSGYAWSANFGWIKFNPAQGGVENDGTGNLSGSAWGANLGWIDFDNVTINGDTGEFSGTATGELVGTIAFDCNHCDVRTDWRETAAPPVVSGGGGGGGGGESSGEEGNVGEEEPILVPPHVNVNDTPLIVVPEQSGTLTQETPAGEVIVEIPNNTVTTTATFTVTEEPLNQTTDYLTIMGTKLIGGTFFNIVARDQEGNEIHSFLNPIVITLPVPAGFVGAENLAVYWLNETNWQWVLIPDAVFVGQRVEFTVNHLTKFGIFMTTDEDSEVSVKPIPSLPLPAGSKPIQEGAPDEQIVSEGNGAASDVDKESFQSIKNANWKLVTPVIVLVSVIFFFFVRRWRRGGDF